MFRAPLHGLEEQHVPCDMLADEVEGEERVAQMIEHAHEDHEVEGLADRTDVIDVELGELDYIVVAEHLGGEPGLIEIALVAVDAEHAARSAAFHFDRIEAGIAANVENGL